MENRRKGINRERIEHERLAKKERELAEKRRETTEL
jgi:hypothetical protein